MKTKLLLLLIVISNIAFAQIPTTGLDANYEFTNGSLIDGANGNNFTKTGNASINVNDRFLAANNAIELNGDHLTRSDINFPHDTFGYGNQASISFWIKTSTNDSEVRTIFEDTNGRSNQADATWAGYYIYLKDGQIGFSLRVQFSGFYSYRGGGLLTNKFVSDGNWHHVVFTIANSKNWSSSGQTNWITTSGRLYIDGVDMGSAGNSQSSTSSLSLAQSHDTAGNITVANNRTNNLPDVNRYHDVIDDINIYTRVITAADVTQLNTNSFCFSPDSSNLTANTITNTSAIINIANSGTYDLAYHKSNEPFSSATQLNNISSGNHNLTSLDIFTNYSVYLREHCTNNTTGWSNPITFKTTRDTGRIYVNHNATGNNNGISWANAYTNLEDALANMINNEEIWVAQGTYKPHFSDRDASYDIVNSGVKLYGGFGGTETMLDQRNPQSNITILSGDLQSDDDTTIEFSNTTRNDNSYNILTINGNNTTIDGFTITGGHANGPNSEHQSGAAIHKTTTIADLTINSCIFNKNVAVASAGAIQSLFGINGTLTITNTKFHDNLARHGTAIYSYTGTNRTGTANIINCIFYNNTAKDNGSTKGFAGSAGWFRAYGSNSVFNCNLINNTYFNNSQLGTYSGLNNFNRSVVGMGYTSGTFNGDVSNCVFWGNTTSGGVTAKSIAQIHTNLGQNINVNNSIGQDGFSTISSGNLTNTANVDPLFTDTSNSDFTLQTGSPAIDGGDGSKVPSGIITDLAGNPRFYNGAVDMGAYEKTCSGTCYTLTVNIVGNGHIESGGNIVSMTSLFDQNAVLSLVPVGSTGYGFYEWSGDATGSANPLALTMDSDKTITVTFTAIPLFVDKDATGTNDGSSWANAFIDLQSALANADMNTVAIWVADGIYKPGSGRSDTFNITVDALEVYGGFNGTETLLSQRDVQNNLTILSGDVNSDDTGVEFTGQNRTENNYHVVSLNSNNSTLDGFTIQNGQADGTTTNSYAGGIFVSETITGFTLKNCDLKNNVGLAGGALRTYFNSNASVTIENCVFNNNLSRYASGMYFLVNANRTVTLGMTNCLFTNNVSKDQNSGAKGYTGSSAWIRANASGSNLTTTITNCTFANNTDIGTQAGSERGTLALGRRTDGSSTHNVTINNSIIYGNTGSGGATTQDINKGHVIYPNQVLVNNSIGESGFSTLLAGNLTNTSNTNPLFTDAANGDYTLQSGSPAIDTGDNTKVPSGITTDIVGNTRIHNTTVDMGCYERINLAIIISPKAFLQGAMLNNGGGNLMRDDLRVAGVIPTTTPFTGGATCNTSVFITTGNDAIVDWVFVELRDKNDNTSVLHSQSALLQRDGDVVDVDGTSSLSFNTSADDYYVAINHRNHLGIMSSTAISLSSTPTTVDFTNSASQITHGSNAQTTFGVPSGIVAMWSGDVNGDSIVQYTGATADTPSILTYALNDAGNFLNFPTFTVNGYSSYDVNMDGGSQYTGATADSPFILQNALAHPGNFLNFTTYSITAQLP